MRLHTRTADLAEWAQTAHLCAALSMLCHEACTRHAPRPCRSDLLCTACICVCSQSERACIDAPRPSRVSLVAPAVCSTVNCALLYKLALQLRVGPAWTPVRCAVSGRPACAPVGLGREPVGVCLDGGTVRRNAPCVRGARDEGRVCGLSSRDAREEGPIQLTQLLVDTLDDRLALLRDLRVPVCEQVPCAVGTRTHTLTER